MRHIFKVAIKEKDNLSRRTHRSLKAHILNINGNPLCGHEGNYHLIEIEYLDLPYVIPCRDCFYQITKEEK